jgi:2,4-dienoyl-CoA reductase-like NADH-dependent reductase (Old Yellow Enzyme family)
MRIPALFTPMTLRDVTLPNRIVVSPMCQYSAHDGLGTDWHIQNLGSKAMGGAGLVFTEATHISAMARITPGCLGLWTDAQEAFIKRLVAMIEYGGGVAGIQVAHAGRKASSQRPWEGGKALLPEDGGWVPDAISAIPFHDNAITPHAMSTDELHGVVEGFAATAKRALDAGFKVLEVHGAHGYLLHSSLSPLGNTRNDQYGGDLKGRARLLMEVLDATRAVWPANLPLFVRLSCSDYAEGGLTLDDTIELCRWLKARGDVDLIDCSGGGILPTVKIPSLHAGYQVPFAERIRAEAGIATGAVGLIRTAELANEVVANGRADLVFLARALLADPAWPLRAATTLGMKPHLVPQYERSVV